MVRDLTRGIFRENVIFVTLIGLCPALAVTTHVINAIGLGAGVLIVLVASNVSVSLLGRIVAPRIQYPVFLGVSALFVTIVDLTMQAHLPGLSERLGIFVPLIAVNCAVLARADVFARQVVPARALLDGLGFGVGFLLSLTLIALIREVLGSGTVTLVAFGDFDGVFAVPRMSDNPARVMVLAPGALLTVGYLVALFSRFRQGPVGHAAGAEDQA